MAHKYHLEHTVTGGPTCQRGRSGGSLRGEHFTFGVAEFMNADTALRCSRCENSSLFAFLKRQQEKEIIASDWEPEAPDAWKIADDALIAKHRAAKAIAA